MSQNIYDKIILDETENIIYMSEIDTYRLVYMNRSCRELLGIKSDENYIGRPCYEVLQGFCSPCAFCTNPYLKEDSFYTWKCYNRMLNRHFALKDKMLRLPDNRRLRLEIATDITETELLHQELNHRLSREKTLLRCIQTLAEIENIQTAIQQLLKIIADFYGGERAYIFEIDSISQTCSNTYEWCSEGITKLSEILGLDYNETLEKCKGDNYYSVIAKKIEKTTVDKVLEFASDNDYKAIHTEETTKRYYPYNELAASVLGFVGTDNQGLNGIESYFDSYLSGTDGKSVSLVNAKSGGIEYDYERLYEAEDGATIELTIDYNIQSFVEKYLQEAVEEHNAAKRGACIAIDVKTGDVLAMATAPGFNCNDPFTIYDDDAQARIDATVDDPATEEDEKAEAKTEEQILQWKNKAITELYEPGSVFKILTAAACLEEGTSSMADTFFCSGYSVVSGVTIKCSSYSKGGHGAEDFTDIMKYSCNVGFMEIASKLGAFQFTRYYNAFGLTEKTGIELPGEESSIYVSYEDMGTVELASSSFGQTNKMSMIELGMAVAACVNGGYLYKPQIVSRIIDANGNVIVNNQPELVRQVISNSTSQKICGILEHVVADSDGTGKNAYVNGYRIGGKSGTAQKLDSTDTSAYVASFLAVAPIDDPQILVYMILDEAHSYSVYGSNLVAPYVGKIMADALPYLGVEPSYADDAQVSVPWVTGKTTIDAETALVKKGLKLNIIGNGTSVVSQFPTGGTSVSAGSTITLYTEEGGDKQMTTVPNLVGFTASTVNKIATNSQLNITIIGTSTSDTVTKSVSQSIPAGESVEVGTVIEVQFQSTIVDE